MTRRALILGWFSFLDCSATAGDLYARDLARDWLEELGYEVDVVVAEPFTGGIAYEAADPADYGLVVFVCGPFPRNDMTQELFERFASVPVIGLNLSMFEPLRDWNPFDALIERDSVRTARPDMTFLSRAPRVPLVGVVLVEEQIEYAERMHDAVELAIGHLLEGRDVARVDIDTNLEVNTTGLRSPRQVESVIARMDAIITTRLHGTVLALKNGVPPLVIDPIAGGRKVLVHARAVGWETVHTADQLDAGKLAASLDFCLSPAGREEARRVGQGAILAAGEIKNRFRDEVLALATWQAGSRDEEGM